MQSTTDKLLKSQRAWCGVHWIGHNRSRKKGKIPVAGEGAFPAPSNKPMHMLEKKSQK